MTYRINKDGTIADNDGNVIETKKTRSVEDLQAELAYALKEEEERKEAAKLDKAKALLEKMGIDEMPEPVESQQIGLPVPEEDYDPTNPVIMYKPNGYLRADGKYYLSAAYQREVAATATAKAAAKRAARKAAAELVEPEVEFEPVKPNAFGKDNRSHLEHVKDRLMQYHNLDRTTANSVCSLLVRWIGYKQFAIIHKEDYDDDGGRTLVCVSTTKDQGDIFMLVREVVNNTPGGKPFRQLRTILDPDESYRNGKTLRALYKSTRPAKKSPGMLKRLAAWYLKR